MLPSSWFFSNTPWLRKVIINVFKWNLNQELISSLHGMCKCTSKMRVFRLLMTGDCIDKKSSQESGVGNKDQESPRWEERADSTMGYFVSISLLLYALMQCLPRSKQAKALLA